MSCFGCTNNTHVTLNQTWTNNGSLSPTTWGPFPTNTSGMVQHEYYCSDCSNSSNFATGMNAWTRGGNVTPANSYRGVSQTNGTWGQCVV